MSALAWLVPASLALAADGPLAPDPRGATARDRAFDLEELRLDLDVDPKRKRVEGSATFRIRRLRPGPFELDQVNLRIDAVTDSAGRPLPYAVDTAQDRLLIDAGATTQVTVRYAARPRTGMHFRDARGGSTYGEFWTQGEGSDNRHWFPGWDHPNDRFVYIGEIRGPTGWKVLTNSGQEVVNYLVMAAGAPYVIHGTAANQVWVPEGTSPRAVARVQAPIPSMMAHFARRTGTPYPWGTYRQVFVQQFLYTGMENTSATVMERALVDGPSIEGTRGHRIEGVVAHELAHQWFGDLVTCRDWRHLWINEGFATFLTEDWMAEAHGDDHAGAAAFRHLQQARTERPLGGSFHDEVDAPNNNVYHKGFATLHMLRKLAGEEPFWAGVRLFVARHGRGLVTTEDFARAMEDATGLELGWFFQQWVELPHIPRLKGTVERHADGASSLLLTQDLEGRPPYTLPIRVDVATRDGVLRLEGWLDGPELRLPLPADARWVAIDPEGAVLAHVTYAQAPEAWEAILREHRSTYARMVAVEALSDTTASEALTETLMDARATPALRQRCAEALAALRKVTELRNAASVTQDSVREAVLDALGETGSAAGISTVLEAAKLDANPDVRAAALTALAQLAPREALTLARSLVRGTISREQVRLLAAAIDVIASRGRASDVDTLLAVQGPDREHGHAVRAAVALVSRLRPDEPWQHEAAPRVQARAVELLNDPDQRVRESLIEPLQTIADRTAANALAACAAREVGALATDAANARDVVRARQRAMEATP